jgi:hypothetical protein
VESYKSPPANPLSHWCLVGFLVTFLPSHVRYLSSPLCSLVLLPALHALQGSSSYIVLYTLSVRYCINLPMPVLTPHHALYYCTLLAIRLSFRLAYVPILCTNTFACLHHCILFLAFSSRISVLPRSLLAFENFNIQICFSYYYPCSVHIAVSFRAVVS